MRMKSESDDENRWCVVKRVSPSIFEQSLEHKREFPDTRRLRMHIDYNLDEHILVYEYFRDDLLSLVRNNQDFPLEARKRILQETGKALEELHAKD
jgi:serine/threonine protein kinase